MSEIRPDDPRGGMRHVEATVVGEGASHDEISAAPEITEPPNVEPISDDPMVPSTDELKAAKYFAIAFLMIVIPLGLLLLGLMILAFVRSLDFLN